MSAASGVLSSVRDVGKHFAVVAGIPSLVISTFAAVAISSGAPGNRPSIGRAAERLGDLGIGGFGLLLVAVLVIGLMLQPFQFALTQLLEGYWGTSRAAHRAMTRSTRRHLDRMLRLEASAVAAGSVFDNEDPELEALAEQQQQLADSESYFADDAHRINELRAALLRSSLPQRLRLQEAERALARYPTNPADLMPTRLGNVLRRFEREAGRPYGLDAVSVAGLLAQVVDPTLRDYYDDARTDLDLAVQTILMWAALTILGFALFWRYDVWLAIPMLTSTLVIVSYRGAVASSEAYGESLASLVALGRFRLYGALHLPMPTSSLTELEQNRRYSEHAQGVGEKQGSSMDFVGSPPAPRLWLPEDGDSRRGLSRAVQGSE